MRIKIKSGLDIPMSAEASGEVKEVPLPSKVTLDLSPFDTLRFTLLKKEGEEVLVGEPLAEDKKCPGRVFVSPASGKMQEIIRGFKRRILSIVIETDQKQTPYLSKGNLMEGGLFPHIQMRPCQRIAHPKQTPEVIFVRAIESAPYAPPPELEIIGQEKMFTAGLEALQKIAPVHLVYRDGTNCKIFTDAPVETHSASGPHPIRNPSVHIAAIHPIKSNSQVVWTLDVSGVIGVGMWTAEGRYYTDRVIAVAGEGIPEKNRGFYRVNRGCSLDVLISEWSDSYRYISGNPLTGKQVEKGGFLGFYHNVFCSLPNPLPKREFLHFLKFFRNSKKVPLTTQQYGEERAFIDGVIYDRVMPLPIHTMPLIKALLAEEYEKGEALGLLEVVAEDFALPAYVCPSKIEMVEIAKEGLKEYASQFLEG